MTTNGGTAQSHLGSTGRAFAPGTMVVVSLSNPREKFWGAMLQLTTAGISISGIDLDSFEDFVSLLRSGEAVVPSQVFFPLHRVERVEGDSRNGTIPSTAERFLDATGQPAVSWLTADGRTCQP